MDYLVNLIFILTMAVWLMMIFEVSKQVASNSTCRCILNLLNLIFEMDVSELLLAKGRNSVSNDSTEGCSMEQLLTWLGFYLHFSCKSSQFPCMLDC